MRRTVHFGMSVAAVSLGLAVFYTMEVFTGLVSSTRGLSDGTHLTVHITVFWDVWKQRATLMVTCLGRVPAHYALCDGWFA